MKHLRAVAAFVVVLAMISPALADKANGAYKAGLEAEARNNTDTAYEAYKRAYDLKTKDPRYAAAYLRLRFKASAEHVHKGEVLLEAGKLTGALAEFVRAAEIDPSNPVAPQEARRTQELIDKAAQLPTGPTEPLAEMAQQVEGPVELRPVSNAPITLRMMENTKLIYTSIGNLAGINVLFDPDYTPRKINIELNGVGLKEALQIVALASKTFWRPVTPNTIYVFADSSGKRKEVEQSVLKTFYLNNISNAVDLTDAGNTIRSLLDITRVQLVPSQNALIVRATPDQLVLAEKLLSDIDKAKAEVMVEIAILEVTRDRLRTLGASLPTTVKAAIVPGGAEAGSLTLNTLKNLRANDVVVSIPSASFTALMSDTNTRIIQNPQVRVLDNQKATLKIGERVPVATGSFSPGVGGVGVSALVNTQFQYLDVGVNIDITPHIHSWRDVTLKIMVEVSAVTGEQNIGGVTEPIIGQRRIEHETRLREGEVNLLGGILVNSETDSISGYPGLAKIPLLRYLFGQNDKTRMQREIVFAITPHIVRAQEVTEQNLRLIDVGTQGEVVLRHTSTRQAPTAPDAGASPKSQVPVQPQAAVPQQPAYVAPASTQTPQSQTGRDQAVAPAISSRSATATPVSASIGSAILSLDPTTLSPAAGSTFEVTVSIAGAKDAFSIPLQLNYDPKRLEVVNVSDGGFLSKNQDPVALVFHADTNQGLLQITGTRPPNSGGVSGSGAVFVLTLLAKEPGDSVLDITGASILDSQMQSSSTPKTSNLLVSVINNNERTGVERENRVPPSQPAEDQRNNPGSEQPTKDQ